jgi:hypothetical protein
MGESMRCPMCGWTGATRTASVSEYETAGPGMARTLVSQTDTLECDKCGRSWDEETFRRAGLCREPVEAGR